MLRVLTFSVAVTLAAPILAAQSPASQSKSSSDQAVFRAGVDVVRLDIRATDADGKPVPDLRADEVEVIDGGVKQPVVLFQHVAPAGRTYVEAAQRTIAGEISTNQGSPRGQLYALLFDQLHIMSGEEQKVRIAAEAFLRKRFRPEDRVAIFGLPGPGPSLPFTPNLSTALAQLKSVRGDMQRTTTAGDRDMTVNEAYEILRGNENIVDRFMTSTGANGLPARTGAIPDVAGKFGGGDPSILRDIVKDHARQVVATADADSRRFLDMTAQVLRGFRGIDGRKTVILFSQGFHSDNIGRAIDDVAAAAAETYSVVYAFDLNKRIDDSTNMPTGSDTATEISSRLEPLGTLAADTNGQLILDATTHLDDALDALGATVPDYYVLGFPAPAAALASRDEYRRVTVRVKRPGVTVSTRTGYVAGPPQTPADRRKTIDTALAAPFGQQGLRVEYTTYIGQSEHGGSQGVALSLDADLPVNLSPNESYADVVFVVRNTMTGEVAASGSDKMALPRAAAPGSTAGVGTWRTRFDLPAGNYLMRCIVREPGGLLGSADRQFVVRALNGPDPAASDLILGTPGDHLPVRATSYTDDMLGGAVRVYGRSEAQLAGLTASLDLLSMAADASERPARTVAGMVGAPRSGGPGLARDIAFSVPMAGLPAGEYLAHVTIRAGGELVADLRRQVQVVDGARPAAVASAASSMSKPAAVQARDVLHGAVVKQIVDAAAHSEVGVVREAAGEAGGGHWPRVAALLASAPAADADAARLRALARFDAEDYPVAADELGRLFDADPHDARLAFVLGWARIGAGSQVAAASAFRSAAFLDPTLVPAHLALAETYMRLNQPALAVQALEAGLTAQPTSVELRQLLETIKK